MTEIIHTPLLFSLVSWLLSLTDASPNLPYSFHSFHISSIIICTHVDTSFHWNITKVLCLIQTFTVLLWKWGIGKKDWKLSCFQTKVCSSSIPSFSRDFQQDRLHVCTCCKHAGTPTPPLSLSPSHPLKGESQWLPSDSRMETAGFHKVFICLSMCSGGSSTLHSRFSGTWELLKGETET